MALQNMCCTFSIGQTVFLNMFWELSYFRQQEKTIVSALEPFGAMWETVRRLDSPPMNSY